MKERFNQFKFLWMVLLVVPFIGLQNANAQCSQWQTIPGTQCTNSAPFTLTGVTPTPGIFFGPGVTGSTFNPATAGAGTHQIGYSANSCTDTAFTSIVVNAFTPATMTGFDTAYCIDQIPQTITPSVNPSGGTLVGPGVTSGSFNIASAGVGNHTVKYFFTNANGCTDTAFSQVHVRALPTVTLNIPAAGQFVCEMDIAYPITGQLPNVGLPAGWFTGVGVDSSQGTFDPLNLLGWNVVTYHYFDGLCSNTAVDSILVTANPTANIDVLNLPSPCINDTLFVLTQGSGTPLGGVGVYSGAGVSASAPYTFDPAIAGVGTHPLTYCYTALNCETCVTQNITVNDVPTVTFPSVTNGNLCENDPAIDLSDPWKGSPAGGYYSGVGIQTDSVTLKPSLMGGPGTYNLTYVYTDANGCSNSDVLSVILNPAPLITFANMDPLPSPNPPTDPSNVTVKICEGDTAFAEFLSTPTANFFIRPSGFNYDKDPNKDEAIFFPEDDFLYYIIGFGSNGCLDTATFSVEVIPPALADLAGDSSICIGDSTTLKATGANNYTWIDFTPPKVLDSIIVSPKSDTVYSVIADSEKDGNGKQCSSDTARMFVMVHPLPLITTANDTTVFFGDQVPLKAYAGVEYVWYEGVAGELSCYECESPISSPRYDPNSSSSRGYLVVGTDSMGCVNRDSMYVFLKADIIVFLPTAFSPNNDGVNDILPLETKGIKSIKFELYDRLGNIVFETQKIGDYWDGTSGGTALNKGVYLYKLYAEPFDKSVDVINQAGQITLVR